MFKPAGKDTTSALTATNRAKAIDPKVQNTNIFPLEAFEFDNPNKLKNPKSDIKLSLKEGWKLDAESILITGTDKGLNEILNNSTVSIEDNRNEITNTKGNLNIVSSTVLSNGIETEASLSLISNRVTATEDDLVEIGAEAAIAAGITIPSVKSDADAAQSDASAAQASVSALTTALYDPTTGDVVNLEAEVVLKAEVQTLGGTPINNAVIKASADSTSSNILLDADKIVLGDIDGNPETLDGLITTNDTAKEVDIGDYVGGAGLRWKQDTATFKIKGSLEGVTGSFAGSLSGSTITGATGRFSSYMGAEDYDSDTSPSAPVIDLLIDVVTPNVSGVSHGTLIVTGYADHSIDGEEFVYLKLGYMISGSTTNLITLGSLISSKCTVSYPTNNIIRLTWAAGAGFFKAKGFGPSIYTAIGTITGMNNGFVYV